MITLEEIAGYLPYGLKVLSIKPDWQTTFEMDTYSNMKGSGIEKRDIHSVISNQYKPVLHPLSDLTCEIEHNGKKFVPYDMLKTIVSEDQWILVCNTINDNYNKIADMPYWWVKTIVSWHFDIYGLIERGDAIDINTLK